MSLLKQNKAIRTIHSLETYQKKDRYIEKRKGSKELKGGNVPSTILENVPHI